MNNKSSIVPIISSDSVEFHLDNKRKVVIWSWVKCFLDLSSLHEVVSWKIFIIGFGRCTKSLSQDILAVKIVVKKVEVPSTVKFKHSIRIDDIFSHIGMSVLKVLLNILQTLEISPNPVFISDCSLKPNWWVALHSLISAYANILIYQDDTIHLGIFIDSAIMNESASSILIPDNLISIQPEEKSASHRPSISIISRQAILQKRTQFFLMNQQLTQSNG